MRAGHQPTEVETETTDQSALRLMLSYVEAECLRMGATDAARHAALAASLMPDAMPKASKVPKLLDAAPRTMDTVAVPETPLAVRRPRSARLH